MVSSFVVAVGFFVAGRQGFAIPAHVSLLVSVAITTVVWLAVTWLTPPTDQRCSSRSTGGSGPPVQAGARWSALPAGWRRPTRW